MCTLASHVMAETLIEYDNGMTQRTDDTGLYGW